MELQTLHLEDLPTSILHRQSNPLATENSQIHSGHKEGGLASQSFGLLFILEVEIDLVFGHKLLVMFTIHMNYVRLSLSTFLDDRSPADLFHGDHLLDGFRDFFI